MLKNYLSLLTILLLTYVSHAQVFTCFDVDPNPYAGSNPYNYTVANGKLFYVSQTKGSRWHVTDGTQPGHALQDSIRSVGSRGVAYNGLFYFYGLDKGYQVWLWASDGTKSGTNEVRKIYDPGQGISSYHELATANNKLYFVSLYGYYHELWVVDSSGSHVVKDINPGMYKGSNPSFLTAFNNKMYFAAYDDTTGTGIWETDGTAQGTKKVIDLSSVKYAFVQNLMVYDSKLYFMAEDATGMHLWASDGTQNGTAIVTPAAFASVNNAAHLVHNNKLYFNAMEVGNPHQLWVTDGATGITKPLHESENTSGSNMVNTDGLVVFKNKVYFRGMYNGSYYLFETDGTDTGTYRVDTNSLYHYGQDPRNMTVYNDYLYFSATSSLPAYNGRRLWRTDGDYITLVDSMMTGHANPLGMNNPFPHQPFAVYNGGMFFTAAYDSSRGYEMWSFYDVPASIKSQQNTTPAPKQAGIHNNLTIYPNPNNGDFTLQLPADIRGDATVSVYDMTGRCVYTKPITPVPQQAGTTDNLPVRQAGKTHPSRSKREQLHLTGKPAGIYQLQLQTADAVFTSRLMLQ